MVALALKNRGLLPNNYGTPTVPLRSSPYSTNTTPRSYSAMNIGGSPVGSAANPGGQYSALNVMGANPGGMSMGANNPGGQYSALSAMKPNAPGGNQSYAKPAFKTSQNKPNVPPNQLGQNLLNFASSGAGAAFGQGLLNKSGYSTMPVSFGEALASGYKSMNEFNKNTQETDFAKEMFEYQKSQDLIKNELKLLEITSKDGRTALAKDMADLYPNLTPGSSQYAEQALKLAQSKSGTYDSTKDFLKSDIGRVDKMFEQVNTQKDVNAVYDRMLAIANNPNFESGKIAELQMPFKRLLVASGMLTEEQAQTFTLQELFETEQSFITPRMRPPGSGASSDFEQKLYASASATLGKTQNVNRLILYARSTYGKLSEVRTNYYDEYLRDNQELPLNKVNKDFDEYLRNNQDVLAEIVGTSNIVNSEEDFKNLIKSGQVQVGDVFFTNIKGDDLYNSHQLFTQDMINGVLNE